MPAEVRGQRLELAVSAGPSAWRAVGLARRLRERGLEVHLKLGPGVEGWVPARTFAVTGADPGVRGAEDAEVSARVIFAPRAAELAELAQGRGWLAPFGGEGSLTPLLIVEVAPKNGAEEPAWLRGPRRALVSAGAVFLEGELSEEALVESIAGGAAPRDLVGATVLITAGPSREHLDPVRFLSNPSSGRMGLALAAAARQRGARVELCLGPVELGVPAGIALHRFESAEELDALVQRLGPEAQIVIASAAVADWRPADRATQKMKKSGERQTLEMLRTPDVLARLSATLGGAPGDAGRPVLVGFAAETENLVANARGKLERKGLDLVVANRVDGPEGAFAAGSSRATLVEAGRETELPHQEKRLLAHAILDRVVQVWEKRS